MRVIRKRTIGSLAGGGTERGRVEGREAGSGGRKGVGGVTGDQKSFLSGTQLEMATLSLQALALMQ